DASRSLVNPVDAVVDVEDLSAARELAANGFAEHRFVGAGHDGANGAAVDGRGGDERHVAKPAHRHLQGARYRSGGEGENVDVAPELFDALLVGHTETLFFIHHQEAELLEMHVFREQTVGADDDVDGAGFQT